MRETQEKRPRERHCGAKGQQTGRDTEGETEREREGVVMYNVHTYIRISSGWSKVDTKWCFQFFAKYDYRFLL
jgi:hypothetical protein